MTTQSAVFGSVTPSKGHCLQIPLDGIIRTDEGRYQANINGTLRHLAYFSDVDCWFTLQESAMGYCLAQPVWRDADGTWQEGSLETLRQRPAVKVSHWQELILPALPAVPTSPQPLPEIIHFIWIGDNPIPADLHARMLANTQRCPSYRFMLHAYPHSAKSWKRLKKQFPAQGRIELVDLRQDAAVTHFLTTELGLYFQKFIHPSTLNYGAAADILRLMLLHKQGGIYLDVDDEITVRIKPEHRLSANKEDILLSRIVTAEKYGLNGYNNSAFACHAKNPILAAIMQEMLVRLKQADDFFNTPRPWYESDTAVNKDKSQKMLAYMRSIFFLTGPILFSDVLKKYAGDSFHIERDLIQAHETLNVFPGEPRIIADDYLEAFHAAKQYYLPFSTPAFYVKIGSAHSWNPGGTPL